MKTKVLLCFLFFLVFNLEAQDYYTKLEADIMESVRQKDFTKGLELTAKMLSVKHENSNARVQQIFCQLNLNKLDAVKAALTEAFVMEPSNSSLYVLSGYYYAAVGNSVKAKEDLIKGIKFSATEGSMDEWVDEFNMVGKNVNRQQELKSIADWVRSTYPTITERWPSIESLVLEYIKEPIINAPRILKITNDFAQRFIKLNMPEMGVACYYRASKFFEVNGLPSEAIEAALGGYQFNKSLGHGNNHYLACQFIVQLMRSYAATENYEKALQYVDEGMTYSQQMNVHGPDIELLIKTSGYYAHLPGVNYDTTKKYMQLYGNAAYNQAVKYPSVDLLLNSANAVCMAYLGTDSEENTSRSIQFGEYALKLAQDNNLESEQYMSNLALAYWREGTEGQRKCLNMYRSVIDKYKAKGDFNGASLDLNNLGAIYYNAGRYEEAAAFFEESVALVGEGTQFTNQKDRLSYYAEQLSSADFLISSYAHTGNAAKAFEALEARRAKVMAERLGKKDNIKPSLKDLQSYLQPDEACIMYSMLSAHEVTILTVTKKYAQVLFHDDPHFIGDFKEKYFNRKNETTSEPTTSQTNNFEWVSLKAQRSVRDNFDRNSMAAREDFERSIKLVRKFFEQPGLSEEILGDFLNRYQKFLIVPILNRLAGIKSLLISPDDLLNFIPFEALRSFDKKYLVEKYSIKYLHSYSILKQLQSRSYSTSRKPLLAMGGAIYQDLDVEPLPINTQEDMNGLQAEVFRKIKTGESLRKEYGSIFSTHALNPLPGTLEEVKNIGNQLPGSVIYSKEEMTENRLKAMSKDGQLQNFKVLHLATHGFVVSEMPDLSGVAMCIFTKEQDGEDGFLNANEIANLKLNADLTVLSACQTAQGKFFTGEGVTGLTQSLIIAGSNAAMVSLWPVNDTSTMLFMSNFYKEVAKGKPYIQIVNELKRKFIKGEFGKEFQHPNFWAPFIYYGK